MNINMNKNNSVYGDDVALKYMLEDFADAYGDQWLIDNLKLWLDYKMGGYWIIQQDKRSK